MSKTKNTPHVMSARLYLFVCKIKTDNTLRYTEWEDNEKELTTIIQFDAISVANHFHDDIRKQINSRGKVIASYLGPPHTQNNHNFFKAIFFPFNFESMSNFECLPVHGKACFRRDKRRHFSQA